MSEYVKTKNERLRFRPSPPVLSHPEDTSALASDGLEPLPIRVFPRSRQFLWSGTAFPYGKTGTEG